MEEIAHPRGAVGAATIAEAFRITAVNRAGEVAVRTKGDEVAWTWGELRDRVDALAAGLSGLGIGPGATVALLLGNRPEFHLCDLAVMTTGATPFSIYMQYTPEQIRFVASDAGASAIITEQRFLPEVRPSWFFAVPRIWEKLKAGLEAMVAGQPDEQREKSQAALRDALEKV